MTSQSTLPKTLGELKQTGWRSRSVKEELRDNLIAAIKGGGRMFENILGYDDTVLPQLQNAILAKHDVLLLGLRGQAKTRIARGIIALLDEWMPALAGAPLNDDPYHPISKSGREMVAEQGSAAPIEWISRERRYHEKLATPDVTIADLIGDIDPIKAVSRKLDLSDEEVIHYGLIPRSNRGLFAINELPDLQARIQVGLFNILEEQDIQIRSFPVRLPLDLFMIFTANPEDYTNRGNIITPLKDRIAAQIMTHYPDNLATAMQITEQEAWVARGGVRVAVPPLMRELIERVAFEARQSEYVDKNSGVSARLPIALLEMIVSSVERRAIAHGRGEGTARVCDLYEGVPAITGKVELVYQGEQEGILKVAYFLIGRAVREAFNDRFVKGYKRGRDRNLDFSAFAPVTEWFEQGRHVEISSDLDDGDYLRRLNEIGSLRQFAAAAAPAGAPDSEIAFWMEFIVDGLNQNFMLTKSVVGPRNVYRDAMTGMMGE